MTQPGWWIEVWSDYAPDGRVTPPGGYRTMGAWYRGRDRDGDYPATWERLYRSAARARRVARSLVEQGAVCLTLLRLADGRSWSWERPDFSIMEPANRPPTAREVVDSLWAKHTGSLVRPAMRGLMVTPDGRRGGVMLYDHGTHWRAALYFVARMETRAYGWVRSCDFACSANGATADDAIEAAIAVAREVGR